MLYKNGIIQYYYSNNNNKKQQHDLLLADVASANPRPLVLTRYFIILLLYLQLAFQTFYLPYSYYDVILVKKKKDTTLFSIELYRLISFSMFFFQIVFVIFSVRRRQRLYNTHRIVSLLHAAHNYTSWLYTKWSIHMQQHHIYRIYTYIESDQDRYAGRCLFIWNIKIKLFLE